MKTAVNILLLVLFYESVSSDPPYMRAGDKYMKPNAVEIKDISLSHKPDTQRSSYRSPLLPWFNWGHPWFWFSNILNKAIVHVNKFPIFLRKTYKDFLLLFDTLGSTFGSQCSKEQKITPGLGQKTTREPPTFDEYQKIKDQFIAELKLNKTLIEQKKQEEEDKRLTSLDPDKLLEELARKNQEAAEKVKIFNEYREIFLKWKFENITDKEIAEILGIPWHENCTEPYEELKSCENSNWEYCSEKYYPGSPVLECTQKCMCEDGYYRDEKQNNLCIPAEKCSKQSCPHRANEVFIPCSEIIKSDNCKDRHNASNSVPPQTCVAKCQCDEGYLRNHLGECVLEKECPDAICVRHPNEEWESCEGINTILEWDKCDERFTLKGPVICTPRCKCKTGYKRNRAKKCVLEEACPDVPCNTSPGSKYEVIQACHIRSGSDSCKHSLNKTLAAPSNSCLPTCMCKTGFWRNDTGQCIPVQSCPEYICSKRKNEEWISCKDPVRYFESCNERHKKGYPRKVCIPKCTCKKGFYRNNARECVKAFECDDVRCIKLENEEWRTCENLPSWELCGERYNKGRPSATCTRKCVCKKGYWRNENDVCVLEDECPDSPCTTNVGSIDEVWTPCHKRSGSDKCKDRELAAQIDTENCTTVSCMCKQDYWRNEKGHCVTLSECDDLLCKQNEEFRTCQNGSRHVCENCKDRFNTGVLSTCIRKCVCKEGYSRNEINLCVPNEFCPDVSCSTNPKTSNEVMTPCSQRISDRCKDRLVEANNATGPPPLANCSMCLCKAGLYKNIYDICVPTEECDDMLCDDDKFEEWRDCTTVYEWEKCEDRFMPGRPRTCSSKCVCKKGYMRDENNNCVLKSDCSEIACHTSPGSVNEVYQECSKRSGSDRCKDRFNTTRPSANCSATCMCKRDYYRNENNICVPLEQCDDLLCNKLQHEVWRTCESKEDYHWVTCDERFKSGSPDKCTRTCVCEKGYFRDTKNTCVLLENCPPKQCRTYLGSEHEVMTPCSVRTGSDTCEDRTKKQNVTLEGCVPKCMCKIGYYRNEKKQCVPIKECDDLLCAKLPYEQWRDCKSDPVWEKCIERFNPGKPENCTRRCVCKSGFLRNDKGTCIRIDKCPDILCNTSPGSLHEIMTPCNIRTGSELCDDRKNASLSKPKPSVNCTAKCMCKKNYWRNDKNECVPVADCDDTKCLKLVNEEWRTCKGTPVTWELCEDRFNEGQPNVSCTRACVCKPGFMRDSNHTCVRKHLCPDVPCHTSPGSLNEAMMPCNIRTGSDLCDDRNNYALSRPRPSKNCVTKCMCKLGYYRDNKNECVPWHQCDDALCLKLKNEVWRTCRGDEVVWENCMERFNLNPPNSNCTRRCVCKKGYMRLENKECVLKDRCPDVPCHTRPGSLHEVITLCSIRIETDLCRDRNELKQNFSKECLPTCMCKKGYLRNYKGDCVPLKECDEVKCLQIPNEEWRACPSSDKLEWERCEERFISHPPMTCTFKCICKKGFKRDHNNTCIAQALCPDVQCNKSLGSLYVWSPCTVRAGSDLCDDRNNATLTSLQPGKNCTVECLCKKGYFRNDKMECVRTNECEDRLCARKGEVWRKCDTKAKWENCDERFNFTDPPGCTRKCVCRDGYLRNEQKKCVPIAACPDMPCAKYSSSAINEIIVPCSIRTGSDFCDDRDNLTAPNPVPSKECTNCMCKKGYFRNNKKECVQLQECDDVLCLKLPNEEWRTCRGKITVTWEKCEERFNLNPPIGNCTRKCVCKEGFMKNEKNECVLIDTCADVPCHTRPGSLNEIMTPCSVRTETDLCKDRNENNQNLSKACLPTCMCKKGFHRNYKSECVPLQECDEVKCLQRPNEEWRSCPSLSEIVWEKCEERFNLEPPPNCTFKCICKSGYYRNINNECITQTLCPDVQCNESLSVLLVWSPCTVRAGSDLCDDRKNATLTRLQPGENCTIKCLCKKGYFRNDKSECVKSNECEDRLCARKGEVWRNCDTKPKWENCDERFNFTDPPGCTRKCVCRDGYLRNEYQKCVPTTACPDIVCGRYRSDAKNEIVTPCTVRTGSDFCDDRHNLTAPNPAPSKECTNCVCKKGYFRNDKKECVPLQECDDVLCLKFRKNEVWRTCRGDTVVWEKCKERFNLKPPNKNCTRRCVCKTGFMRLESNECVPEDRCPDVPCHTSPGSVNEAMTPCSIRTETDLCKDRNELKQNNSKECLPACMCKTGYHRNYKNNCVPLTECDEVKCLQLQNEEWRACPSMNKLEWENCDERFKQVKPTDCTFKCICKNGFYRDANYKCIADALCPDLQCNKSLSALLVWTPCTVRAGSDLCDDRNNAALTRQTPGQNCTVECLCKKGYFRNDKSECVKSNECDDRLCAKKGEVWRKCDTKAKWENCDERFNFPDPSNCTRKCVCRDGYLRNEKQKCVPIAACSDLVCGTYHSDSKNEIITPCRIRTGSDFCDDRHNLTTPSPEPSKECTNCVCKKGYFRNDKKECVLLQECDDVLCLKLRKNEVWRTCRGDTVVWEKCKERFNLEPPNTNCTRRCVCKTGFMRLENNECVPVGKCPDVTCHTSPGSLNEVITPCSIRTETDLCKDRNNPKQNNSKECLPACMCMAGYHRNYKNECVPLEDCDEVKCLKLQNEEWRSCPSTGKLEWEKCDQRFKQEKPTDCTFKCICKKGFYRDVNYKCIASDLCPDVQCNKSLSALLVWSLCTVRAGSDRCDDRNNDALTRLKPGESCTLKCLCKKGYFRNDNSECVKSNDCEDRICAKKGEMWRKCDTKAKWENCDERFHFTDPPGCTRKCVCRDGYLRNEKKVCVPVAACPEVVCHTSPGSSNEWLTLCSIRTGSDACDDRNNVISGPELPKNCTNCVCKKGYFRNNEKKCVPLKECDDVLCSKNKNEEWRTCRENTVVWEKCDERFNLGRPNTTCTRTCVCKAGYKRDANNECILEAKCPEVTCHTSPGSLNEVITPCTIRTETDLCKDRNNLQQNFSKDCHPKCMCKKGYHRNYKNECVPLKECDEVKCLQLQNEVWRPCPSEDLAWEKCDDRFNQTQPADCTFKCICKKGYHRNAQNECIATAQCRKPKAFIEDLLN